MKPETALTNEQQVFATEHHTLIYKYLHSRGLPVDEYYDVVVFGYLQACKRYFEQEELQQYQFTTIAWQAMDSALSNEWKKRTRKKRSAVLLSFNKNGLELLVGSADVDHIELSFVWSVLQEHATVKQMQALVLQYAGYKALEIGEMCGGIKPGSVYSRLYRLRKKARKQTYSFYSRVE